MSFAAPLVLLGLAALPALAAVYVLEQRRRARAAVAFVSAPLLDSVAPHRPGWRRHAPYTLMALGLAALIVAVARPQLWVHRPVKGASVMLVNDVSNSMKATDVRPSRLMAAKRAAISFLQRVGPSIEVGSIEFARHPVLLQSPSTDHALTGAAVEEIRPGGGGTAMGDAIEMALGSIRAAPKLDGRRPPGAVIVISDGASNVGGDPVMAARAARHERIRIYTISIGTPHGTVRLRRRDGRSVTTQVPVDPTELGQVAAASGGHAYRAADAATLNAIYSHLATTLGHRRVRQQLIAFVAAAGLVLVALGAVLSLLWFGRAV